MGMHTLSSREFTARVAEAKRWADKSPVFINDRGRPTHVLLAIAEYERLTTGGKNIVDTLAMPEADEYDFEPPKARIGLRPLPGERDGE
jgi:hypothetical protein